MLAEDAVGGRNVGPAHHTARRTDARHLDALGGSPCEQIARLITRQALMSSQPTCNTDTHGAPGATPDAASQAPAILVIENHPANRMSYEMLLRIERFRCTACATADAGWQALQTSAFDLVIADLSAGALDLMAHMHEDAAFAHIPVIVVTGDREERSEQGARNAGAAAYLVKPTPNDKLLAEVRRCLSGESA